MKKIFEKHGVLNCVGALMDVLAFILFVVAAFVIASFTNFLSNQKETQNITLIF